MLPLCGGMAFSAAQSEPSGSPVHKRCAAPLAQRFLSGPDSAALRACACGTMAFRTQADMWVHVTCRGKYADVPYISESVYLQVDASL